MAKKKAFWAAENPGRCVPWLKEGKKREHSKSKQTSVYVYLKLYHPVRSFNDEKIKIKSETGKWIKLYHVIALFLTHTCSQSLFLVDKSIVSCSVIGLAML